MDSGITEEEFRAVLALEGKYELMVRPIQNHRHGNRWEAALAFRPSYTAWLGAAAVVHSKSRDWAIQKLIKVYADH